MLGRLILGIVKGLIVGGLLGFGLAKLGYGAPIAIVAYLAAALAGVLVGLIAGKPIWAKDAKIEAGMKAVAGALFGVGLMYLARRFLTMPVPLPLGELGGANESLNEVAGSAGTFGGLAITSLAAVAALLGGFYEADNTPEDEARPGAKPEAKAAAGGNKRIAASSAVDELDDDLDAEPEKKRAKK
jgi:hypothetical protein